ncbi:SIR2 family NAD-dependent protein deacylase [Allostreptomyces psammosilenae]|uniref:protein acetyllysine N-acetyltransferase n=1 Tax=Allostreptomyces psammosilenae TaxID=1892865 RepID=A0A852ZTF0_9ACTN|nr:Sir2 family NAD-dependent protein deacetylase [Allostreptomyces psammosilenae]NYI04817.1 NAD-dependent deacetylase [Allostreptomyces psammosilenae]
MTDQRAAAGRAPDGDERAPRRLVAVLTGAGISTDSGIPDYRGPQGLWRRDPEAEKLVTYRYYMDDPAIRRRSWLARRDHPAWTAEPGAGHRALVRLERAGVPLRILTQNVDGLHQRAGSSPRRVLELHGSMFAVVCTACGERSTMREALDRVAAGEEDPPCHACGGILKSGTVMFGEALDPRTLGQAATVAGACDEFWAVGTSLRVEPAASLCRVAAESGARLVVVNAEPTPYDGLADEVVREPIGSALPRLVERLIEGLVDG